MEITANTQHISYVCHSGKSLRLDKFLVSNITGYSRSQIKKIINSESVVINGQIITDCSYLVRYKDEVSIVLDESKLESKIIAKYLPFQVIYEDEYLLIVDKPSGLTVHPGAGNNTHTLVNALLAVYGNNLSNIAGDDRPGIVHRIDKDTSGLMIVAKNNHSHILLAKQLEARMIKRFYMALVYGAITVPIGTINADIGRNKKERTKMAVVNSGRQAITHYKVLKILGNHTVSMVQCKLETGRTHQIRVHFSFIRHPIIGDRTYIKSQNFNLSSLPDSVACMVRNFPRQALHSHSLEFIHPITLQQMSFTSPLPQDIKSLINNLELL